MRYTWRVIKMHAAPVSGWLCRDLTIGCDQDDEMIENILAHIFMGSDPMLVWSRLPYKQLRQPTTGMDSLQEDVRENILGHSSSASQPTTGSRDSHPDTGMHPTSSTCIAS